ncbi:hypothetical protein GCM10007216_29150 [Thalassobacillus devorans]|uniref:Polymerase nucleotidyl transferase domain-containing protein n=1 Tax=Thalassobacillus devorans TaxID=279813 RepID=A0ABQ1PG20_9BACI|nr:nucleotidyltransferase domain-containing protein [Thalassobacillus devorans]NIK29420.1 hypothetical protein [Thalassobacillus devorans]GGC96565.1 hypothetical protein GCM10007216_29150 [Thalassobacillus devorans]
MDKKIMAIADRFIKAHFPHAAIVFIGGSTVQGNITSESDIDLIIIDEEEFSSALECHLFEGWRIEAFVYHPSSVPIHFEAGRYKGLPTFIKMCMEGVQITGDRKEGNKIKAKAREIYEAGPSPWSQQQIDEARYAVTDLLSDFTSSTRADEEIFILHELTNKLTELVLRGNTHWLGWGKWQARSLRSYSPELSEQITHLYKAYIQTNQKEDVLRFVQQQLEEFGGEKFSGHREEHL